MPWKSADPTKPRLWLGELARAAGWVVAGLGAAGVVGWLAGLEWLLQPAGAFPPISPLESVGMLVMGAALLETAGGGRRFASFGGGAIAVLGLATLLRQAVSAGLTLPPPVAGGEAVSLLILPVSSALLTACSGVGLIGLGLPPDADRGRLTAGACGAIIVVLCLGILAARVAWQADTEGGLLVGSSLQFLLATLILGFLLAATTWAKNPATVAAPWLPLSVGAASLVTVILLWRAFVGTDREQILEQTERAGRFAAQRVEQQILSSTRMLSRLARFGSVPWPASRENDNKTVALTRDVDGLLAIAWADTGLAVRQIQPEVLDADSLRREMNLLLSDNPPAPGGAQAQLPRYLPLTDQQRFIIVVPACSGSTCRGNVIGLFSAEDMLSPVLGDSGGGFLYAVTSERRTIVAPPGRLATPVRWTRHTAFTADQLRWDIASWPASATLARHRSGLSDLLLLLGLLISTLLPVAIRLGQLNLTRARLAERVRFKLALETATDGIWEWEVASGTAVRSDALWRRLGYDPAVMNGRADPWPWLIHEDDQPRIMRALAALLGGESRNFEARYRIRASRGDWHWMVDRGQVVEWTPAGQPKRLLGISADVTERTRADEALATSERRFRACFEGAQQVQVLVDGWGRVLEANRAALEFAGLEIDAMAGQPLWELPCWSSHPGVPALIIECVLAALDGSPVQRELELEHEGGEVQLLELSFSPIPGGDGRVSQLLIDARDVTIRRRTMEALREVESLTTMGRIAARVAHEINNPLAGIQNSMLLIKDAVPPDHPHRSYVGAVEREIRRIAAVTRQLYETYRPEGEGNRDTALTTIVGDAVALLRQINRGAEPRIEVDLTGAPGMVPLPEAVLRQILYNLVQNAIDASPPGGLIGVEATIEDNALVISVSDAGSGIPAEIRDRVFEPFFTTKSAATQTGGMGLGLHLVARSAQALGGRVDINDRARGGTLVVVRLPLPVPSGATV